VRMTTICVGPFFAMAGGSQTVGGGPDGTRFKQRAGERNGCTTPSVVKVKKEMLVGRQEGLLPSRTLPQRGGANPNET
jgi:hypothetical protein